VPTRTPTEPAPLPAFFAPAPPRVFAHRGLAIDAPENTPLAFAKAIAAGAGYIETDVHASADGIAMIAHDEDLKRTAGRDVRVAQLTKSELARLDLGQQQHMPTLAEVLDGFPETRFNIDIKSVDAVDPVVRTILDLKAVDRVLVSSFDERRRRAAVAALPGVATSASATRFLRALAAAKVGADAAVRRALRGIHAVQIPERALRVSTITPRTLSAFHAAGVEVHVWTINEPDRMRLLLDAGVDGIVTDRADLALQVVAERG
jgi:glycerophosphoryl diester phosphodiesterase